MMAIRDILLPVQDDLGQQARFGCAMSIAAATGASIRCLSVETDPVALDDGWPMAALLSEARRADETVSRHAMEVRLLRLGVQCRWLRGVGNYLDVVSSNGRGADLVILDGASGAGDGGELCQTVDAVLSSGVRAVLTLPHADAVFLVEDIAAIAWNASSAAKSAVHAALPLLLMADRIIVVTIGSVSTSDVSELMILLASVRHKVSIVVHDAADDAGQTLLAALVECGSSYCVMGACNEKSFSGQNSGSVTKTMLRDYPFPLLLSC